MGTQSDRILEALRQSAHPLDDDQLSACAEIGSWQQVNRLCRTLERDGRIRRIVASDQRIVNEFVPPAFSGAALDPSEPAVLGALLGSPEPSVLGFTGAGLVPAPRRPELLSAGRGSVDLRRALLDRLGEQLGLALEPATITVESSGEVEVDGADAGRTVLVACWTRPSRPAHTVFADVLKLSWIGGTLQPRPRLILCLGDPVAAEQFRPESGSWAAHALRDIGVTVTVVDPI